MLALGIEEKVGLLHVFGALKHPGFLLLVAIGRPEVVELGDVNRVLENEAYGPVLVEDGRMGCAPEPFLQLDASVAVTRNAIPDERELVRRSRREHTRQ